MTKALVDIYFVDLLPSSISGDPTIRAAAQALDAVLAQTTANINAINIWSRIDDIEEPLLSTLAWQLHVDYWDKAWPDSAKRATIKKAYILHMRKGTPAAVEDAVSAAVGSNCLVKEWFEYGGEPGYFRVQTEKSTTGWSPSVFDGLVILIKKNKNVRSWLSSLRFIRQASLLLSAGMVLITRPRITIAPYVARITIADTTLYHATGVYQYSRITI